MALSIVEVSKYGSSIRFRLSGQPSTEFVHAMERLDPRYRFDDAGYGNYGAGFALAFNDEAEIPMILQRAKAHVREARAMFPAIIAQREAREREERQAVASRKAAFDKVARDAGLNPKDSQGCIVAGLMLVPHALVAVCNAATGQ